MKELVLALMRCGNPFPVVIGLHDPVQVEGQLKELEKKYVVDGLWIAGTVPDPVLVFWKMREAGALRDTCYTVFTDIQDSPSWNDLVKVYGGIRFGKLFLMVYTSTTKPGVCPSQRGMYMR